MAMLYINTFILFYYLFYQNETHCVKILVLLYHKMTVVLTLHIYFGIVLQN
jgi:hypothetical protein